MQIKLIEIKPEYFLLFIFCALYFAFSYKFYLREYEVPDYFLYHSFGLLNLPAKDGFSSLFIFLTRFLITNHNFIHFALLSSMTFSLFIINISFIKVSNSFVNNICFIVLTFSSGCWYYFYGKIFYEFPFISLLFSLSLLVQKKLLIDNITFDRNQDESKKDSIFVCLFLFISGFCLSWKATYIFPLLGLLALFFINNKHVLVKSIIKKFWFLIFMVFGFLCGNYKLVTNFSETLNGLKAYPANCSLMEFLFFNNKFVWDHINLSSFDLSVYSLYSCFCFLFVCPFLFPNKIILICFNIFLCFIYLSAIKFFSMGYTWYGFQFALYIITYSFYLLIQSEKISFLKRKVFYAFFFCAVLFQFYNNFFLYVPEQIKWFNETDRSICTMEKNAKKINEEISKIIKKQGFQYYIDIKIKRDKVGVGNPLYVGDPDGWKSIEKSMSKMEDANYTIFIEPYALYKVPFYTREELIHSNTMHYNDFVIGCFLKNKTKL
jgi:hypothetical protein